MIQPGNILISHPRWGERESVCFITEHTRYSTVALQLNLPTSIQFADLALEKGYDCVENLPVFRGGDYNRSALIMLHDSSWYSSNTMAVTPELSISSDLHMIEKVCEGNTPLHYRYIMGITAWPPRSLENQLAQERPPWLLVPNPDPELIFADSERQYELALNAASEKFWDTLI